MAKRRFDIDRVMQRVADAVRDLPAAALFELAEEGFDSVFEQLVACIISIRTRDEVTLPVARALLSRARSPEELHHLGPEGIDRLIASATFHERKSRTIHRLAGRTAAEFAGVLPCDAGVLTSFPGVGPKCANLALGVACGVAGIAVDIHVHRVTNRWGYVSARTPEATMRALEERLPRKYWVEINRVLVPFGKHVCRGRLPRCSTCPVLEYCRQEGVTSHA